jgi:hypothetical protein
MNRRVFLASLVAATGASAATVMLAHSQATPPAGPLAPPIRSTAWINSAPLAWDALRGRVVMIEFWTYG